MLLINSTLLLLLLLATGKVLVWASRMNVVIPLEYYDNVDVLDDGGDSDDDLGQSVIDLHRNLKAPSSLFGYKLWLRPPTPNSDPDKSPLIPEKSRRSPLQPDSSDRLLRFLKGRLEDLDIFDIDDVVVEDSDEEERINPQEIFGGDGVGSSSSDDDDEVDDDEKIEEIGNPLDTTISTVVTPVESPLNQSIKPITVADLKIPNQIQVQNILNQLMNGASLSTITAANSETTVQTSSASSTRDVSKPPTTASFGNQSQIQDILGNMINGGKKPELPLNDSSSSSSDDDDDDSKDSGPLHQPLRRPTVANVAASTPAAASQFSLPSYSTQLDSLPARQLIHAEILVIESAKFRIIADPKSGRVTKRIIELEPDSKVKIVMSQRAWNEFAPILATK